MSNEREGAFNPLYFFGQDDYIEKPIYSLDETMDGKDKFIITKTTDNGKYNIGNMLRYTFNGVDIITEDTNAIFVDTIGNTVTIKSFTKTMNEINPVDPEERQYVLLLYCGDEEAIWESVVGRTSAYEYIKSHITIFDPDESIILTDNVALKEALTVTQFVTHLHNADIVKDDFSIDDYKWL